MAVKKIVAMANAVEGTMRVHCLDRLGWTQQEIADQMGVLFPEAKGSDQAQISRLLCKNGESELLHKILTDLKAGQPPRHLCSRCLR